LTIFDSYRYKGLFELQNTFFAGFSGKIQMRPNAQGAAQQGEEYVQRRILLLSQPIISEGNDIFDTRGLWLT